MTKTLIRKCLHETDMTQLNDATHSIGPYRFNTSRYENNYRLGYSVFINALTCHLVDIITPQWALGFDGHRPLTSEEDMNVLDKQFENHMNDGAIWIKLCTWTPEILKEYTSEKEHLDIIENGECKCICINLQRHGGAVTEEQCNYYVQTNLHTHIICKFYEYVDQDNVDNWLSSNIIRQPVRARDIATTNEEKVKMFRDVNCREAKCAWNCRFWSERTFPPFARKVWQWRNYFKNSVLFPEYHVIERNEV